MLAFCPVPSRPVRFDSFSVSGVSDRVEDRDGITGVASAGGGSRRGLCSRGPCKAQGYREAEVRCVQRQGRGSVLGQDRPIGPMFRRRGGRGCPVFPSNSGSVFAGI